MRWNAVLYFGQMPKIRNPLPKVNHPAAAQDIQVDCDKISRTGTGLKDWWLQLTKHAVMNKYDAWAVPWLAVLRGLDWQSGN